MPFYMLRLKNLKHDNLRCPRENIVVKAKISKKYLTYLRNDLKVPIYTTT